MNEGLVEPEFVEFQLTCPVRGTTRPIRRSRNIHGISTHVPRAGHDYIRSRE